MPETTFIYGLVDPRTQELRYVGKSDDPQKRLGTHMKDRKRTHKVYWLNELRSAGMLPVVTVIEEVPQSMWSETERKWIAYYRATDFRLTNTTEGGENPPSAKGLRRSEVTKEKIRQSKLGKKRPADVIRRMSIARKGKGGFIPSQETKDKRRKTRAGYRHSEETRKKLSAGTTRYYRNKKYGNQLPLF